MVVTKLQPVGKTRFKVFIEEQFAFELYKGELSRYRITEGSAILEETVSKINQEIIAKRVKLRAMHLLNTMDRTEADLRSKLERGGYTADMIELALGYVKSFGYIDDEKYAKRFAESKKDSKSKLEIRSALTRKGIKKEYIEHALQECMGEEDEREAILRAMRKKGYTPEEKNPEKKQKMMGYLMRKGFRYESIRQVIQVSDWDA